jgi:hypothetical protein
MGKGLCRDQLRFSQSGDMRAKIVQGTLNVNLPEKIRVYVVPVSIQADKFVIGPVEV